MANNIYARSKNIVGYTEDGYTLCQAVLWTENTPDNLPISGAEIIGMSDKDVFAAGSCLICTVDKKIYLMGKDKGTFALWKGDS